MSQYSTEVWNEQGNAIMEVWDEKVPREMAGEARCLSSQMLCLLKGRVRGNKGSCNRRHGCRLLHSD